jgi:hypothetical protein
MAAKTLAKIAAVALIALLAVPAPAVEPPETAVGVLSLIDDNGVEIRYRGTYTELRAASFGETLAAVSIAASTPPSPITPWLVDLALHAAGIPHQDYRSCWPDDGAILIVPTAPLQVVDLALQSAGQYFDPTRHPKEFAASYWSRLFTYRDQSAPSPPGWPGKPDMESLKESIVGQIPYPANMAPMSTYQARGVVPFLQIKGEYAVVCFLFFCWVFPKCVVSFEPTAEGYGIRGIK